MKYCENCKEERDDQYKFCKICGTLLIEKTAEEPALQADENQNMEFRFCNECGKKLPANVKFCSGCGTKILPVSMVKASEFTAPEITAPEITAPEITTPLPEIQMSTEPQFEAYSYVEPEPIPKPQVQISQNPPKKEMSTGIKALIIVGIAVAAIVLFIIAFLATEFIAFDTTPDDLFRQYILKEDVVDSDKDIDDDLDEDADAEDDDDEGDIRTDADEDDFAEGSSDVVEAVEAEPTPTPTPTPTPEPTPEPTPTPIVWEDWDIDADALQAEADKYVKDTDNNRGHYKKRSTDYTTYYIQSGVPVIMIEDADYTNWKYNLKFVGSGIFYVEFSDDYSVWARYYFTEGRLFRVIEDGIYHEYGEDGWEEYEEIAQKLIKEREALSDEMP